MTRAKLKVLLEEYGRVAVVTYFVIFALTLAGFALAISYGLNVESAKGGAGLLISSYVATKLTQPLRIAATLGLAPLVATALRKFRARKGIPATTPGTPLPSTPPNATPPSE